MMCTMTAIGALCVVLSAWPGWLDAPISGRGASLPFGWLAMGLGGVESIAWWYRSRKLLVLCGVVGLGVVGFAVLYLTIVDPVLWSLVDEHAQYAQIVQFSRHYLPANLGIEPDFQPSLATETLLERLTTATYFMGWGWWICLGGSALLLTGCCKIGRGQPVCWTASAIVVVCAAQSALLFNGFVAQYYQAQGDQSLAHGRYAEAIQQYESAQQWSPQFMRSVQTHFQLGEAYYHLGQRDQPYGQFYLGHHYAQQNHNEAAMVAYRLAAQKASAPLQKLIRSRLAWLSIELGLTQYRQGQIGQAIAYWERALAFDPVQLQAAYFLTRAYFEQSRYEQSIAIGRFLLSHSRHRLLNANVQANIGDSYWKHHDFTLARRAYEASRRLDPYANFRISKSLGGT